MKIFLRALFLIGLLTGAVAAVGAKDRVGGRVAGNIADFLGEPIRDAFIQIVQMVEDGESLVTLRSDARGAFKTATLTPGVYYLRVTHRDYRPVETTRFVVDESRSVALEIALRKFTDALTRDDDPRNQGFGEVLRGVSDRRLIFRSASSDRVVVNNFPNNSNNAFTRGGAMRIESGSSSGEGYVLRPQASQSGVSSNFAFTEPLSDDSRIILSGQIDTGAGSFWRIRNTYNYRPDRDHDYSISVGYGHMAGNHLVMDAVATSPDYLNLPDGLETFAFSTEGSTRLFDLLSIRYGVDYSRLHYGRDKSFFHPSLQIVLKPAAGWNLETSIVSRRLSEESSIVLPGGEVMNLAEPTLITLVGDKISMSQVRHSEVVARRQLAPETSLEFGVYQDYINGPGLPLLISAITPLEQQSCVIEMNEEHSSQQGLRLGLQHKLLDYINGSIVYVYGESREISADAHMVTTVSLRDHPEDYLRQSYRHSVTGRLDAFIPLTKTSIIATLRWNSGNSLTALDWFSDKMDIGTNSANLELRQILPLPAFLDISGRWELLVELRNAMNQGSKTMVTADGIVVFNRNPRSARFGLNYTFR